MSEFTIGEVAMRFLSQNFRYSVGDAADSAQANDWSGFEFVTGTDGEPLVMPDGWASGHQCHQLLDESNANEAQNILYRATGDRYSFDEYAGCLAYDYGNPKAREAAESIGNRLADYPILDEEDFSEREWQSAEEALAECYNVPADIVTDVVRALFDGGHSLCSDCSGFPVESIMEDMGYRECEDCTEYIETAIVGAVCFDCAESYGNGDAVFLVVDTARHVGVYPTQANLWDAEDEDRESEDSEKFENDPNQIVMF